MVDMVDMVACDVWAFSFLSNRKSVTGDRI